MGGGNEKAEKKNNLDLFIYDDICGDVDGGFFYGKGYRKQQVFDQAYVHYPYGNKLETHGGDKYHSGGGSG